MGEKWHCFAICISWHRIGSKNLEKVEHGAKWNALMIRPGQVWPGQAMQSYLDLKTYIQHSACYTEATYQIPCQSGNRAWSNYCRYTDRLRAFKHFSYQSAHRNQYLKKFKVPATLFGTLHGDVLPMICAKCCWFWRGQTYFKMHFSNLTLKGQRSFRGHDTFMT